MAQNHGDPKQSGSGDLKHEPQTTRTQDCVNPKPRGPKTTQNQDREVPRPRGHKTTRPRDFEILSLWPCTPSTTYYKSFITIENSPSLRFENQLFKSFESASSRSYKSSPTILQELLVPWPLLSSF